MCRYGIRRGSRGNGYKRGQRRGVDRVSADGAGRGARDAGEPEDLRAVRTGIFAGGARAGMRAVRGEAGRAERIDAAGNGGGNSGVGTADGAPHGTGAGLLLDDAAGESVTLVSGMKLGQMTEANVELSLEQSLLLEIQRVRVAQEEMKGQVSDFRTVLLGSKDGDTEFGRLPMVERATRRLESKVEALEEARLVAGVYGSVVTKTGHFVSGFLGGVITLIADIVFRVVWHR